MTNDDNEKEVIKTQGKNIDTKIEKESEKENRKSKFKIKSYCIKYSLPTYVAIGITLFLLALMLTAQMKAISNTKEVIQGKREAQLADDLVSLQRKYNDLKNEYEKNSKVVEEYQSNASNNDVLINSMKQELDNLRLLSGTVDVKGEGIVITLNDGVNTNLENASDVLVHDSDVLTVVNELKAAGAEAISVNGQRIISTSAIRCVGPVIQINYQKVAAPFVIKAIGNSQFLESAMNIKNGITDTLRELGLGIVVERNNNIKIPKYEGSLTFEKVVEDK